MTWARRRPKSSTDANQAPIVSALRAMGCSVQDLSAVGSGCPDLLVGVAGVNLLLEVKNPDAKHGDSFRAKHGGLRKSQKDWHDAWRGQRTVVRSVAEAINVVNAVRRSA